MVEKVKLFSESVTGLAVRLRDWRCPVVFNTQTGETKFDNCGGQWGKQQRLDEFLQAYAVERAKLEARRKGHSVSEQSLADGSIKIRSCCRLAALLDTPLDHLVSQARDVIRSVDPQSLRDQASLRQHVVQQLTRWLRDLPIDRDLVCNLLASELVVH